MDTEKLKEEMMGISMSSYTNGGVNAIKALLIVFEEELKPAIQEIKILEVIEILKHAQAKIEELKK